MHAQPLAPSPTVSGRRASAGYWVRLLPSFALLACVTRIPSFTRPVWSPDEGYLAVQARLLAQGGELYETVVDRKPPLVPWLYQGVFALAGSESLTPVRILAVLAQFATALALASLARRRWGDTAGRTAGVLYLLVSVGLNPEDAQAAGFEVFMLPFTAAALWCADRRLWGMAGLAAGCAFLAKQTGGAVLIPVLWLWLRDARGGRRGGAPRLAAGAAAPALGAALVTDPGGFLFWTVTGSGTYAWLGDSGAHALSRGLVNAAIVAVACAGLIPPVVRALSGGREGARGPGSGGAARGRPAGWAGRGARGGGRAGRTPAGGPGTTADLWLWLAASAGAVTVGFHFFGHYYLQLLPPLALLAAAALRGRPAYRRTAALRTSACCCVLFLAWGLLAPRTELDHALRLAGTVAGRTGPGDRVLIWGMHPETYWLADRAPATRYLTAGLLTNYSGGRVGSRVGEKYAVEGAWEVFHEEMATRPPALVVDDSRGKPYGPRRVPGLRRLLDAGYVRAGKVDGAVLYVRGGG
ncbi:glycosyltransferase family 39 protein [Streptomyces sp. NPDC052020]|uniref:ArnT family glycosyltransferase n=1 Tax=Streptomyces sp. NPDC052020 TaxID=3155677 RepID=UPI00342531EB